MRRKRSTVTERTDQPCQNEHGKSQSTIVNTKKFTLQFGIQYGAASSLYSRSRFRLHQNRFQWWRRRSSCSVRLDFNLCVVRILVTVVNSRFPTLVGHSTSLNKTLIGDQAQSNFTQLQNIIHPVQRGVVADWDAKQKLLNHTFFNELRVAPEESNFLIVDSPSNTEPNRLKLTQMLMETFEIPTLSFASSIFLVSCSNSSPGIVRLSLSF